MRRVERWVTRWCEWYTATLPIEAASERRAEVASDLNDHAADGATRAAVVSRWLRGIPADLVWRHAQIREARATGILAAPDTMTRVATALAAVMAAWGLTATGRVLVEHGVRVDASTLPMVALGAALSALGLIAFARSKTRALGSAILSVAAFVTVTAAADASAAVSWSGAQILSRAASSVVTGLSMPVAVGLLYLPAIIASALFVAAGARSARRARRD